MYRKQVLAPKAKERETERFGRTKESREGKYNTTAWKRTREQHLQDSPLCIECEKKGRYVAAQVVDHISPADEAPELFFDRDNLQSLCNFHHQLKTNADKARRNKQAKLERGRKIMQQFESDEPVGGRLKS